MNTRNLHLILAITGVILFAAIAVAVNVALNPPTPQERTTRDMQLIWAGAMAEHTDGDFCRTWRMHRGMTLNVLDSAITSTKGYNPDRTVIAEYLDTHCTRTTP